MSLTQTRQSGGILAGWINEEQTMSKQNSTSRAQPTPGNLVVIPGLSGAHVRSDIAGGLDVAWFGCNSTYGNDGNHCIGPDEAEANARLFVAAPKLLKALEAAFDLRVSQHPEWEKLARAAIAKANGGKP